MITFDQFYKKQLPKVAILPGGFKPPHKGHFEAFKHLLSFADSGVIIVGNITRDNITQEQSIEIWNVYKRYINKPITVITANNPVTAMYKLIEDTTKQFYLGAGNKDKDLKRFEWLQKRSNDFPHVQIIELVLQCDGLSGTQVRQAINNNDPTVIDLFTPIELSETDKEQVAHILHIHK